MAKVNNFNNMYPWGGAGTNVEDLLDVEEMIKKAGLDWDISKEPLTVALTRPDVEGGRVFKFVPKKYTISRKDNDDIVGIVGKVFNPINNFVAFGLFDALTASLQNKFIDAGFFGLGERVWAIGKIPGEIRIKGSDDIINKYLVLSNAYNGTKSLEMGFTPVRFCNKTALNISTSYLSDKFSLRHTKNADEKMKEAAKVLKLTNEYYESIGDIYNHLADIPLTGENVKDIINKLLPLPEQDAPKQTKDAQEIIQNLFETGEYVKEFKGTGWALFTSVAEYADSYKSYRSDKTNPKSRQENRFKAILGGDAQDIKNEAIKAILSLDV